MKQFGCVLHDVHDSDIQHIWNCVIVQEQIWCQAQTHDEKIWVSLTYMSNQQVDQTYISFFSSKCYKAAASSSAPSVFFLCFFPEFLISGRWRWLNTVSAVKSSDLLVCHIKGLLTFPAVSSNHRSSLCPRGHITDSSHDTESKPSSLKEMSNFLEVSYNVEICLSLFMELG